MAQCFDATVDQPVDTTDSIHIGSECMPANPFGDPLQLVGRSGDNQQVGTSSGEGDSHLLANTRRCAGDNHVLVLELHESQMVPHQTLLCTGGTHG